MNKMTETTKDSAQSREQATNTQQTRSKQRSWLLGKARLRQAGKDQALEIAKSKKQATNAQEAVIVVVMRNTLEGG
jgi:hypothetical protein